MSAYKDHSLFMLNKYPLLRIVRGILTFSLGVALLYTYTLPAKAEISYNLLAPLPGGTNQVFGDKAFSDYAQQAFAFLLSAAAILALLMVVVGGIEYLSSGESPQRLQDAKDRITKALLGLVLALASWLILNTINPHLLSSDFALPDVGNMSSPTSLECGTSVGKPNNCACSDASQCAGGQCTQGRCTGNSPVNTCAKETGRPETCPCDTSSQCATDYCPAGFCLKQPSASGSDCTTTDGSGKDTGCRCTVNSECKSNTCHGVPVAKCA